MTTECPNCKTPLPRQGSRFCNQCGFELRPALDETTNPGVGGDSEDSIITDPMEIPGASPAATLRIISRDGSILERKVEKVETTIGKGTANDIILADPAVSTSHAMISSESKGYIITDLGSRNGTFVNDTRIDAPRQLHHGDVVKLGKCTLTFRLSQSGETAILAPSALAAIVRPEPPHVTADALAAAVVSAGLADEEQIKEIRAAGTSGKHLIKSLIQKLKISDVALRDLMSSKFGIPTADPSLLRIDQGMATALTAAVIRRDLVFPAATGNPGHVTLIVADPTDEEAIAKVKEKARGEVELRLASATEVKTAIDSVYAPRLVGVLPSGEKLEVLVNKPEIEIGKAPHNQIILTQPTVSNTHAVILARNGGYSVVDLGSSNGTFVNGVRLGNEARTLQHGDKIQIAEALLTYRNPSETTENKTARLSPEILEEVRKKASMGISLSSAHLDADGKDETDEKQDGKKKKKKDDRIKAALIGSASRLIAQVVGGLVTIAGTIYLLSWSQGTNGPGLRKAQQQAAGKRFSEPPSFSPILGGIFEASGVTWVPETNTALVVDDGKPGQILLMTLDENGKQQGPMGSIPLNALIIDPEAITTDGTWYYVISSQADPKDGPQNSLVRFDYDPATKSIRGTPEVLPDLRTFLLNGVPDLAAEGSKPGTKGGLNIEGLTFDPVNNRLLVGLRSPLIQGRAVIIPIKIENPRAPLTAANLKLLSPSTIQLELDGQGIRDIDYNPQLKSFTILSGATDLEKKTEFGLWEWNGDADLSKAENVPKRELSLDDRAKPEGITNFTVNGKQFVLIVGDLSRYLKLDYASMP